jgi:hypothetical protein
MKEDDPLPEPMVVYVFEFGWGPATELSKACAVDEVCCYHKRLLGDQTTLSKHKSCAIKVSCMNPIS